jgi:decaprenylphospho-beta-D-erythro-pentofuranosid-2-ulose 2-reductase
LGDSNPAVEAEDMNVVVIGASSGVGRAVASAFARGGHVVACAARDETELGAIAADLEIRHGCHAHALAVDLSCHDSVTSFLERLDGRISTVDCLVVTAATMPADGSPYHDAHELLHTTSTNYVGIALIVGEVARRMEQAGGGTIVCASSVAGDRGRASNFVYGASKAALNTYLEGLRMRLWRAGVSVVTLKLGYVDTLMSYGRVHGLLAVSPDYVARRIYRLVGKTAKGIYLPWIWRPIMAVVRVMPETVLKRLSI